MQRINFAAAAAAAVTKTASGEEQVTTFFFGLANTVSLDLSAHVMSDKHNGETLSSLSSV